MGWVGPMGQVIRGGFKKLGAGFKVRPLGTRITNLRHFLISFGRLILRGGMSRNLMVGPNMAK